MTSDLHTTVTDRLHRVGQRYTSGRRVLVEVLDKAGRPVTLPDILRAAPQLAQSSAYRNLVVLEQADVARRIAGAGEFARYELVEELTGHHHHLVCATCGAVTDVDLPRTLERQLERTLQTMAEQEGFEVTGHRLDIEGGCARCVSRAQRKRA